MFKSRKIIVIINFLFLIVSFLFGCVNEIITDVYENGKTKEVKINKGRQMPKNLIAEYTYFKNGKLREEILYLSEDWKRQVKYYDSSGVLIRKSNYKGEMLDGEYCNYYDNGELFVKGQYTLGNHTGQWIEFYKNKDTLSVYSFENRKWGFKPPTEGRILKFQNPVDTLIAQKSYKLEILYHNYPNDLLFFTCDNGGISRSVHREYGITIMPYRSGKFRILVAVLYWDKHRTKSRKHIDEIIFEVKD